MGIAEHTFPFGERSQRPFHATCRPCARTSMCLSNILGGSLSQAASMLLDLSSSTASRRCSEPPAHGV